MAAPNEELLLLAQTLEFSDNVRCTIQQAADLLQSQAERIKVLEAKVEQLKVVPMKYRRMAFNAQLQKENEALKATAAKTDDAVTWATEKVEQIIAERDALRTQVAELSKDAERYQILRNPDYQQHEDDISVSDSSFNVYFGDDLDREVDGLKDRHDAIMNAGDKPPQVGIDLPVMPKL